MAVKPMDTRVPEVTARANGRARPRRLLPAASACLLLALAGCSSSSSSHSTSSATPSASKTVTGGANQIGIKNFAFHPSSLTVKPGTVVTVTNNDQTTHTATAIGTKAFDTGDISPGQTKTFTAPKAAGAYHYMCTIHQYMKGTLTVS